MTLPAPSGFRGVFRQDAEALAVYSEAAGIGRILPRAVAVPRDAEDVVALVKWARAGGHPLIPRGSGSSMAGGAIGDGVIMDLSRLRGVSEPEPGERTIRADVGVLRGEIDRRAGTAGLRLPVDPSSGEFCTIGGMVATNAAGPRSLRHGSIRPWVLALECVFDDGSLATVRRGDPPPPVAAVRRFMSEASAQVIDAGEDTQAQAGVLKNSSGYAIRTYAQTQEIVDLLVGSEGTLAVFTGVEVAIIPSATARASLFVSFRQLEGAVEAAVASRELGTTACELLDRTFVSIANRAGQSLPVSADAEAALIVEVESHDAPSAMAEAQRLLVLFRRLGADDAIVTAEAAREAELWSFRQAASPAIAKMDARLRSMQFIEDAAVPPSVLPAYVRGVRKILERSETTGVIFGHAGDAHIHVNPLIDTTDPSWRERVERILLEVTDLVAQLGGTITGEHGDGRLRTPILDQVWNANARATFALIKQCFDPQNMLNPGVKVPMPGQKALDVVKYDPTIEAHPPAARQALDTVERERAYARFRLDLL